MCPCDQVMIHPISLNPKGLHDGIVDRLFAYTSTSSARLQVLGICFGQQMMHVSS